jgi:hypothetical protein
MMLTAVMDAAVADEGAIAAPGHDDPPPASAVSVTTGLTGAPLAAARKEHVMKNGLLIVAGIVVIIIGAVFALQGFGVIQGSAMSDNHTFEVAGPLVALAGLALAGLGLRHRGSASQ